MRRNPQINFRFKTNMATGKMDRHVALLFFIVSCIYCTFAEEGRHSRFEYKQSFKGPHLVNKQGNIPFWNYYGSKKMFENWDEISNFFLFIFDNMTNNHYEDT